MNCDDYASMMEKSLDDELEEEQAQRLASHLAGCKDCAREYQLLQREREIYSEYSNSRPIEVSPPLWSAIRARLEAESQPGRWSSLRNWLTAVITTPRLSPALTAGLVLMVLAVSLVLLRYWRLERHGSQHAVEVQSAKQEREPTLRSPVPPVERHPPASAVANEQQSVSGRFSVRRQQSGRETLGAPQTKTAVATRGRNGPTVEQLVREAEQKYLAAVQLLSRDVRKRGPTLDPDVRARFEETLAAIDRTIADTRQAVRQRPADPEAVRYMLTAYAKKVEVLQEMASY